MAPNPSRGRQLCLSVRSGCRSLSAAGEKITAAVANDSGEAEQPAFNAKAGVQRGTIRDGTIMWGRKEGGAVL